MSTIPTPVFPGAVVTDGQLTVANDRVRTSFALPVAPGDTVVRVADVSLFRANMLISANSELMKVVGTNANDVTVTRGWAGTLPASHAIGTLVSGYVTAWHHNANAAEIKAIEESLGANLVNVRKSAFVGMMDGITGNVDFIPTSGLVDGPLPAASAANDGFWVVVTVAGTPPSGPMVGQVLGVGDWVISNGSTWTKIDIGTATSWLGLADKPVYDVREYQWILTNGVGAAADLTSTGLKTITLTPVPQGVNGTDVAHQVYISGGGGTPELCMIAGGTAIGGSASGTIIVTTVNAHTGSWTVETATGGLQEAHNVCPEKGQVLIPLDIHVRGTCTIQKQISFAGIAQWLTGITQLTANTPVFKTIGTVTLFNIIITDLTIGTTSAPWSSRAAIELINTGICQIRNVRVYGFNGALPAIYRAILVDQSIIVRVTNCLIQQTVDSGIEITGLVGRKSAEVFITEFAITGTGGDAIRIGGFTGGIYIRNGTAYSMQGSYAVNLTGPAQTGDSGYFIQSNDFSAAPQDAAVNAGVIRVNTTGVTLIQGNEILHGSGLPGILGDTGAIDLQIQGNVFLRNGDVPSVELRKAGVVMANRFNGGYGSPGSPAINVTSANTGAAIQGNVFQGYPGTAIAMHASATNQSCFNNICLDSSADFITYTGTSFRGGNNQWLNLAQIPTIASAATITLDRVTETYFISGDTVITQINGFSHSRVVRLIFTHATPAGVQSGGGNIAKTVAATTLDVMTLVYDTLTAGWYPQN